MAFRLKVLRAFTSQEGAIGVVLALFLSLSVSVCAIAVDMGSLYLERRTLQGSADLAALAAAGDISNAEAAARVTLAANGFGAPVALRLTTGRYLADASVEPGLRFVANAEPANAVRVDVTTRGELHFARSFMSQPEISVSAIGTTDAQATFSIGSRLAAVRDGLANALLGGLLGGNVALSVMDYNALLGANVSLFQFLSALATEVGVTAGTYNDVLNAQANVGNVLRAAAQAAGANGNAAAAQAVTTLLSQSTTSAVVPLSALVDLGPLAQAVIGPQQPGLGADLNMMSLVTAAASLANGNSQVSVNLGAAVPGLLSLKADVAIGEPMQHSGWVAVGQPGSAVRTAQTRLRLVAEVGGSGLLSGVRIRLPLYIELASAEAQLKKVACHGPGDANATTTIEARPAVVRAWIGDVPTVGLKSFGSSVPVSRGAMVDALLVRVTGSAYAEMTNTSGSSLVFTQSDVDGHVVKTVSVRDPLASLVASLLGSVNLDVNILGLGIGLSVAGVKGLVTAALTPVAALLDTIVDPLLELVGVHVGEADVQVNGMRCGSAVLSG